MQFTVSGATLWQRLKNSGSADGTATDLAEVVAQLQFNEQGLIPAIAQDYESGAVLMLAWMDHHAIQRSLDEGFAVYYSRSRQEYWRKGDTSDMCKNWSVCLSTAMAIQCSKGAPNRCACHTDRHMLLS